MTAEIFSINWVEYKWLIDFCLQLILIAKDHGTQTTYETIQFLTVMLKDIDDNKPMFQPRDGSYEYIFPVNENNREKQLIGKQPKTSSCDWRVVQFVKIVNILCQYFKLVVFLLHYFNLYTVWF